MSADNKSGAPVEPVETATGLLSADNKRPRSLCGLLRNPRRNASQSRKAAALLLPTAQLAQTRLRLARRARARVNSRAACPTTTPSPSRDTCT